MEYNGKNRVNEEKGSEFSWLLVIVIDICYFLYI